ncbi:SPFH domain-containing protein [Rhizobium sp. RCAM05973]|uniref:SPFH domain-containing protein n=1 Tax=Rhizobium sp. RCAM05973 TaxID=2994066 RepID=UPI0022EBA4A2
MTDAHAHPGLDHHGHDHHHSHGGDHNVTMPFRWSRLIVAMIVVAIILVAACLVQVRSGAATIITRFGNPARVLIDPGLAFRLPIPLEKTIDVDLRAKSTSSGLQDVGTKDGLRIIAQAYAIWQVPPIRMPSSASCGRFRTSRIRRQRKSARSWDHRWKPEPAISTCRR